MYSKAAQAAKRASRQRTAADEMIRRWVQDRGSKETTDPDSEEDIIPPRAQAVPPSRTAESSRVHDDKSGELQDLDSLEGNGGRPAPGGNQGDSSDNGTGLLKESLPTVPDRFNKPVFPSNPQKAENC